jgi:hypothetical protein
MSLELWLNEGKIKLHQTSLEEIDQLFEAIERNLKDASIKELSFDNRFTIAYQAALQLALIPLYAFGYRPSASVGHHYITIQSLKFTIGKSEKTRIYYLDNCRRIRNASEYERSGIATASGVKELIEDVIEFKQEILNWLKKFHPHLLP